MYAGKVCSVQIPTPEPDFGKLIILSNGYIYFVTESHWDREKRHTRDNRVGIGKVDPDHPGMMFPGKKFEQFFGKPQGDPKADSLMEHYAASKRKEAGKLDFTLSFAPFVVLEKASEHTGMVSARKRAIPKLWKEILALAGHAVIAEQSTAQSFPGWAFDNWCGLTRPPTDSTISRIYSEIANTHGCIEVFFELYREGYHRFFPRSHERVVAFDSSNQVSESKEQIKARRGKSKTGEKLPSINTAMYVDEITGISLWYEHFDGNVLDKTQTPYSVEKAKQLGFEKLFLMMDRGYYSEENVRRISNLHIAFGMMMPETSSFVTGLIKKHKDELRLREEHYIPSEDSYGIQVSVTLPFGVYYAYVYYDDGTATEERNTIHGQIKYFLSEAEKRTRYTTKMKEHFAKRGIKVTKTPRDRELGKNFKIEVDHEMAQQAYEESGFFVILSNRLMRAAEMISIARRRDVAEKGFRDLKSHFMLSRTQTHNDATYSGKMFTAFIALVMLQSFRWFARPVLLAKSSETVATLLAELKKYKIQESKNGNWFPVYAMNKKQKAVLSTVQLTEEEVEKRVRDLKIHRL